MKRALVVFFGLLVACGGAQKAATPKEPKVDIGKYLPATLEAGHPKKGDPRTAHVRVWADASVRAAPHWKEDITEQVDYASQWLTPFLGVKLVVDEFKDWDRSKDESDALSALAKADDGHDVTWVLGYVAANDTATRAMSELGDARPLGRHIIIHAWAEKPETDRIAATLPVMDPTQRTELLAAHKRHKQTVVLLDELTLTLGAIAEADPTRIRHPMYSPKISTQSDRNRDLIQHSIDGRLGDATDVAIAHDLLEAIEKQDWGGWIPIDHDQLIATLRTVVDAGKAGKTASDVPQPALEQFDKIRELRKSNPQQALVELDNLLVAYPGNATMVEAKCEIMIDKPGVANANTRATCAKVATLAPGDPTVHFAVGEALAKTKDMKGARAELEQAAAKIPNLKDAQGDAWRRLIGIYAGMGALTWTDEAIAASHLEHDPAAAVIAQTRARYGVPPGAKFVKPVDEGALVSALQGANALIYASKYGDAERALDAAGRKWPGAAGISASRCDLALRQSQIDSARAHCNRAIAADPTDSWALYLAGVLAFKDTSAAGTARGIDLLKKAVAADPDLGQAWRALAKAYARENNTAALDQLGKDYQAKFGQAL